VWERFGEKAWVSLEVTRPGSEEPVAGVHYLPLNAQVRPKTCRGIRERGIAVGGS
jgi:hypothetical protein